MDGKKTIYWKIVEVRKEIGWMEKAWFNEAQKYNYFSDDQIAEKFRTLFNKNWIVFEYSSKITWTREISPTRSWTKQFVTDVEVEYKFADVETGEFISWFSCWSWNDTGDKWVYKAITWAVKYIFMKTFQISTGDDPETDNIKERKPWTKEVSKKESAPIENDEPEWIFKQKFTETDFINFKWAIKEWKLDVLNEIWRVDSEKKELVLQKIKSKYDIEAKRLAEIAWFFLLLDQ